MAILVGLDHHPRRSSRLANAWLKRPHCCSSSTSSEKTSKRSGTAPTLTHTYCNSWRRSAKAVLVFRSSC